MTPIVENTLYRDAADVLRYHTKRTIRQQTVGQHSFNMLMLVQQVVPDCRKEVLLAIMHHDLPELKTGDIPGPIKRVHPSLGPLLDQIEEGLYPLFKPFGLREDEEKLLKWADRMEGCLWCMEEVRMGDTFCARTAEKYMTWILESAVTGEPYGGLTATHAFTHDVITYMRSHNMRAAARPQHERD